MYPSLTLWQELISKNTTIQSMMATHRSEIAQLRDVNVQMQRRIDTLEHEYTVLNASKTESVAKLNSQARDVVPSYGVEAILLCQYNLIGWLNVSDQSK